MTDSILGLGYYLNQKCNFLFDNIETIETETFNYFLVQEDL